MTENIVLWLQIHSVKLLLKLNWINWWFVSKRCFLQRKGNIWMCLKSIRFATWCLSSSWQPTGGASTHLRSLCYVSRCPSAFLTHGFVDCFCLELFFLASLAAFWWCLAVCNIHESERASRAEWWLRDFVRWHSSLSAEHEASMLQRQGG